MNEETKDKVIAAIQSILESSLTTALDNLVKAHPKTNITEILPIILSRFAYRELVVLCHHGKIDIKKMRDLYVALFNDLVELNLEATILAQT